MAESFNERLKTFLLKAHAHGYASGNLKNNKPTTPLRFGAEETIYNEGEFSHHDSWFGGGEFLGSEVVSHAGTVCWGMNYWGHVIKEPANIDRKTIYSFLQKCLRVGVEDGIPFRGPNYWTTETFTFESHTEGNLSEFTGEEFIYYKNEMIYYARFHGGSIGE